MRIRSWSYARISLLLAATAITPVLVASGVRAAGQPQPLAHVAYILRGLAVQPAHRAAQTASVGTPVFPQDGADTQAGQRASFRFRDGTALHLNQETSVIFRSPSETELARGEIAQYLTPGSTHRIVTASAIASAIGTEIDVYLHGNDSIFVVLEGALQVSNAHGSVVVKNNQETTVAPGAAPTPPSPVDAQAVFAWNASIPTPDLGKDIALDSNGGVIVGSSSEAASAAGTWDVQRVNDGVLSEGWASADGQTQDQFVKIGFHGFIGHTSFRVSGVVIDPAATSGDSASEDLRDFEIRVSTTGTDDASFATVFIGTCRQEAVLQRFPFPAAVVAKYVELVALDNYGSTERVAVAELEVVATTTAFNYPTGLALDRRGNLYVADTANNRIQEISPRGTVLHLWGSKGNGDGQFLNPMGVGVGRNGQIVVADTFNHRVQFFSSPAHFLRTFRDASQLTTPTTVALDTQDTAYVGDSSGRRILKLSSTGRLLASWALSRSAPFPCTSPGALAVDPAGAVWDAYYASATNGHYRIRVEKRAPNGRVLVSWSLPGVVSTCDNAGMAVDAAENVWLTLTAVHEVEELTPAGRKIARWGGLGLGVGRFIQPIGIAVGSQGAVWVADSGNDRVQKLTPRGKSVAQFGSYGTIPQTLGECPGVAVDVHGYAYITDFSNDRIQVRAPDGSVAAILGHRGLPVIGRGPPTVPLGQFDRPWGIAVGQDGAIYVADQIGDRIQKLAPRGPIAAFGAVPVGAFGGSGQGPGFNRPDGVAVARSGDLYVADTGNNRIVKLAPDGSVVASWGSRGSGPGQFNGPAGVAVDQDGNVFVADAANNRIQEFTPSGQFLAMWGTLGSGPGQFRLPAAIAVDAAGNLYVADALNGRVQKLSHDGHPLAQWSGGSGSSQLAVPTGVAVDAQGNVYVADLGAFQVVKLSPDGAVLAIWS